VTEYDGKHHVYIVKFGGKKKTSDAQALENLERIKLHDQIKNEHCKAKCIPLLRIPHTITKYEAIKAAVIAFLAQRK
jgi:hypothetical protein